MGNLGGRKQLPVEFSPEYEYVVHAERPQHLGRKASALDRSAIHGMLCPPRNALAAQPGDDIAALMEGCGCNCESEQRREMNFRYGSHAPMRHHMQRQPSEYTDKVHKVLKRIQDLVRYVAAEPRDTLDQDWSCPGDVLPLDFMLDSKNKIANAQFMQGLSELVQEKLHQDDTLVMVEPPVRVFGDIHGQFRDMLLFFADFGFPSNNGPVFIFNGDWVDRGRHQLEVVVLIFALKVAFPQKIVLVRGNHEDPEMNVSMGEFGFRQRCIDRLDAKPGEAIFNAVHTAFEWLPLACVIGGQILVVHGGIGSGDWSLARVRSTMRPLNHNELVSDPVLWNILWSDPIVDEHRDSFGVHSSPRDDHARIMKRFGKDITASFCERNGLTMVVRSHQAFVKGKGYEVMHDGRLVRVFSARDYEGFQNDASILDIQKSPNGHLVVKPLVLLAMTKEMHFFKSGPYGSRRRRKTITADQSSSHCQSQ